MVLVGAGLKGQGPSSPPSYNYKVRINIHWLTLTLTVAGTLTLSRAGSSLVSVRSSHVVGL